MVVIAIRLTFLSWLIIISMIAISGIAASGMQRKYLEVTVKGNAGNTLIGALGHSNVIGVKRKEHLTQ